MFRREELRIEGRRAKIVEFSPFDPLPFLHSLPREVEYGEIWPRHDPTELGIDQIAEGRVEPRAAFRFQAEVI